MTNPGNPTDLPSGHIRIDGREYVTLELFEAANQHVTEQGAYINQITGTMAELARERIASREQIDRLHRELHATNAELAQCQRTQAAMRAAVHGAAEAL